MLGALAGAFAIALGVGLLDRARTPLEVVGSLLLPILGAVLLISVVAVSIPRKPAPSPVNDVRDGEAAQFYRRNAGPPWIAAQVAIALPGLWSAAMAVVGMLAGAWGWAVFVLPATCFLVGPLAALAGTKPGGVWLTPTRLVDQRPDVHASVRLAEIAAVAATGPQVSLTLMPGASAEVARAPWSPGSRRPASRLRIDVATIAPEFTDRLREAVLRSREDVGGSAAAAARPHRDPAALPVRPIEGRAGEVAGDVALAVGALALAWLLEAPLGGSRTPIAVHLVAGYAVLAGLVLIGHAVALAVTPGFPRLAASVRDGVEGFGVRSWPGDQWRDSALDLGLAALGIGTFGLDLATGGSWLPWSVVPGLTGLWFLVRAALWLGGRKRRDALWIGGGVVVTDGPDGTRRAPLASVRGVEGLSGPRGGAVVITLSQPAAGQQCPRLWRWRAPEDRRLQLDVSRIGHDPHDLASLELLTRPAPPEP